MKKPPNMKGEVMYTITLAKRQAQIVSRACEVLSRLGIGQWREILDHLPLNDKLDYEQYHANVHEIGWLLSGHMKHQVDGWHSSLGIHSQDVRDESRVAWDLCQVIRHRLSWDRAVEEGIVESKDSPRKWPEMLQVVYDEPMKAGDEPLAVIECLNPAIAG